MLTTCVLVSFPRLCRHFFVGLLALGATLTCLSARPVVHAGGWNLHPVEYWDQANYFGDVMMEAHAWQKNWADYQAADNFTVDARGYPTNMPGGVSPAAKVTLDDAGRYTLRWTGAGTVRLKEVDAADVAFISEDLSGPIKERVYEKLTPNTESELAQVLVESLPVSDIELWAPGYAPAMGAEPDKIFHDSFLARISEDVSILRFMDWGYTNHSKQTTWADRRQPDWFTQTRPTAYEYMVELCNATDTDLWVCVPHQVDDDYVRRLATLLHTGMDNGVQTGPALKPGLKIYIEYSNELWNTEFSQSTYAQEQADLDPETSNKHVWAGKRSAQIWKLFQEEIGTGWENRIVRVMATHQANAHITNHLQGIALVSGTQADAMAIATYWSHKLGDYVVDNLDYMNPTEADYLAAIEECERNIRQELLPQLTSRAKEAANAGLELICYEGGQHTTTVWRDFNGNGNWDDSTDRTHRNAQTRFLNDLNRRQDMGALHTLMFDFWEQVGGGVYLAFNDVGPYKDFGSWGYREYWWQSTAEAPKAYAFEHWLKRQQNSHILTFDMGVGSLGHPYDGVIEMDLRTATHTLAVTSGSLPHGLSLNNDGTFSGIIQDYGSFAFEITLTDLTGFSDTRAYTMEVTPVTSPIVIYPVADTYGVGWSSDAINGDQIYLLSGNSFREVYAKWDVSILAGKVINSADVVLELYNTSVPVSTGYFYTNDASWEEDTLTYATRPALGPQVSSFPIDPALGLLQRADVSQWIKDSVGSTQIGLTLICDDSISWRSKEYVGNNGFTLEVMAQPDMLVPITYDNWAQVQFGDSSLPDAQPDANPDQDGMINQLEYVFGADPQSSEPLPYTLTIENGRKIFRLPVHSSHRDKQVRVLGCGSMETWQDVHFDSASSSLSYGWHTIEIDLTDSFTAHGGRYFVRVEVGDRP